MVLQEQVAELTETTGHLRRQVADKETAAAEAQAEKQAVEGELATCQQELDCLRAMLNETQQMLEESSQKLEAAEEGLEALRAEVGEMTATKDLTEKEKAELERQLAAEKAQWGTREKDLVEDLRVAEQRANLAEQEKESVTQQVEDLKSMEETLKSALERKRKEEAKLGVVRERVNDLEAALGLMKEKLREAEGENRALKQGEVGWVQRINHLKFLNRRLGVLFYGLDIGVKSWGDKRDDLQGNARSGRLSRTRRGFGCVMMRKASSF